MKKPEKCGHKWGMVLLLFSWAAWLGLRTAPAAAQTVSFTATSDPNGVVANTGLSETLGDITLTAGAGCGSNTDQLCQSIASTIQVRFTNVAIDNNVGTGMQICEFVGGISTCNAAGNFLNGVFTVSGGTLSLGVRDGVDVATGDQITIKGVRARIAGTILATPGLDANVEFSSIPFNAETFPAQTLVVGHSADPLLLRVFSVPAIPCAAGDAIPTAQIVEGYPSAFVDYGDPLERNYKGAPVPTRPVFGGNTNTRVGVTLSGLAAGVKVEWPVTIAAQNSNSVLNLIATSADTSSATYIYETPDQQVADSITEIFALRLNPINFSFSGTGALSGIVSLQTQLLPPPAPESMRPRYNHPLEPVPAEPFFLLQRCTPAVTSTGKITIHADVDGLLWSGTLNYSLQGPVLLNGTQTPDTLNNVPADVYQATYLSGGPAGATFSGISPFSAQSLPASGTIDYLFDFTGPTIANLQLSGVTAAVCPSANAQVGSFTLTNATTDQQIIPAGTLVTITYSNLLVTPPAVTNSPFDANPTVGASSVTYRVSTAFTVQPGGVIGFSAATLNLNGATNGQNITVMVAGLPSTALQLNVSQVSVATASQAQCPPLATLSVQPSSITRGQSAVLSWTSQFATSLNIQPGIGPVQPQGSMSVSPTNTTTYTLTATGTGGSVQVTAQLNVNAPPPVFSSTGVTNGASFIPGVTPGAITSLFGVRLSNVTGINLASTLPLPTSLLGTSVTVNSVQAPLFAVDNVNGQEQINFQVPWEAAQQSTATIVVNNNGVSSDPVVINVQPVLPGVFTTDGTNGAILHGVGSAPVTQANPAVPGETIVLFATGLGPVSNTPATGAAAGSSPTSQTPTKPAVTIGNVAANVDFSGLAPGFVGLYQLNVVVPLNAPSGSQDVVVQFGGQASKPVKLAIR